MLDTELRRVTIFRQRNLLMNRVVMHLSDLIAVTMGSSNQEVQFSNFVPICRKGAYGIDH